MRRGRQEPSISHTMYPLWAVVNGWPRKEVVGSFAYMPNVIAMLGGDFNPRGAEVRRTVQLVPEPQNNHDRNAVSVRFGAKTVGYLSREEAVRYQPALLELMGRRFIPTAQARIWASEYSEWDEKSRRERKVARAQISVSVSDPETMLPLNDPPVEPYTLLPESGAVQVGKTAEHFDVLSQYRTPGGVAAVIVTLVPLEERTARTVKRVAEIRLDGTRIGQLTPAMSEKFLPAVDHLLARGLTVAASAAITSSTVSAKVSVYAQKAFELSPEVLNGPARMIPPRGIPRPVFAVAATNLDTQSGLPTTPGNSNSAANPAVTAEPVAATGGFSAAAPDRTAAGTAPMDLDDSGAETQTAILPSGSRITVTESPATGLVTVTLVFAHQLTTWQSRIASEVLATGRRLTNGHGSHSATTELTATTLIAVAPLSQAQAFVDALIGIDDSDFAAAQHFTAQ